MLYTITWMYGDELRESKQTLYIRGKQPEGRALEKIRRGTNPFFTSPDYFPGALFVMCVLAVLFSVVLSLRADSAGNVAIHILCTVALCVMAVYFGHLFRASLLLTQAEKQRENTNISEFEVFDYLEYTMPLAKITNAVRALDSNVEMRIDSPYDTWIKYELETHSELGRRIGDIFDAFWKENEGLLQLQYEHDLTSDKLADIAEMMRPSLDQAAAHIHELLANTEESTFVSEQREENVKKRQEAKSRADTAYAQLIASREHPTS